MAELIPIALRTLFFYALIILIFRMMGKREIGELSILDLVVYIMIAELAVAAIDDPNNQLFHVVMPMLLLMIIQIVFAFISLKSKHFRDVVEGKPTLIINKGKIDEKEMKKQRYNFDDLLLQLREQNVRNIADVEFAILETSGKLTVFEKEKNQSSYTIPLIIDGEIQTKNLERIEKNPLWLRQELRKRGYRDVKKISFCSFQNGDFFIDVQDFR
ncbi:DUF421 domain-containing protein [Robertmurraya sp. DFI.2.37]|uniref:DUF421 domain-containing protein n=1 Tax=Robertmurraya sp. DFI.2.37 TaxID=3031819 RepID=UPI001246EBFA|nr:DUF421 domain-containing protein [Robertmurraya sp. DFI.2.37]MDF1506846.1 DUF421 domain-containing protein [Robertmurraya sp. DFI.2.37]